MSAHQDQEGSPAGQDDVGEALAARIEARIEGRVRSRIYGLHVSCDGLALILQGQARTYHVKQLAQEAALDLTGGDFRLINQIGVG